MLKHERLDTSFNSPPSSAFEKRLLAVILWQELYWDLTGKEILFIHTVVRALDRALDSDDNTAEPEPLPHQKGEFDPTFASTRSPVTAEFMAVIEGQQRYRALHVDMQIFIQELVRYMAVLLEVGSKVATRELANGP